MLFSHKIEGNPTISANMDVWKLKNKTLCFYLESKNNRILGSLPIPNLIDEKNQYPERERERETDSSLVSAGFWTQSRALYGWFSFCPKLCV